MKITFFILISAFCINIYSQNNIMNNAKYLPKTIIFKVKPANKSVCNSFKINNSDFEKLLTNIKTKTLTKKFPNIQNTFEKNNSFGDKLVDISTIYELEYSSDIDINKVIKQIKSFNFIEYAQPHYVDELLLSQYLPNDPKRTEQYYLATIKAYEAWDLVGGKGDTNIVIGIVDTGVDIDHEDLMDNIKYNYADPIDGIDNDNDGFTDNFRGWDVANNDNNPNVDNHNHGIYVAGIAAATTDNEIGISGTGFKSKFLPVKIINADNIITSGYEGIVYAAEHGCKIINCSWGSTSGHSYGQDIINYATFNRGALVVGAGGNNNNNVPFYPASYENVLNVAGTNIDDFKWGNSSYGYTIDISAPGQNIYSTDNNSGYIQTWGGTSFAAPIVAGAAAIVASFFPNYSPLQIAEKLRITTDCIDALNPGYENLLGKGRLNLYNALTVNNIPSVRFVDYSFTGSNQYFAANDTVLISGNFRNYLASANNVTITLISMSSYIEVVNSTFNAGTLNTLDSVSISATPFKIVIKNNIPYDEKIILKLSYSNDYVGCPDFQFISFVGNISYYNLYTEHLATTITANGRFGTLSNDLPIGLGFQYNGSESVLYEAGLMLASSSTSVSNCIRDDDDFEIVEPTSERGLLNGSSWIYSEFKEVPDSNNFNINIQQRTYSGFSQPNSDFIIAEYYFINQNSYPITNFYAGIFADWDIDNPAYNSSDFNTSQNLAYTFATDSTSIVTGIKLLTNQQVNRYALDNSPGGGGGIDITNGFTNEEKYLVLSNDRFKAGLIGNDVVDVISAGPNNIPANDTLIVAFAILACDNLSSLNNIATISQNKYDSLYTFKSKISASFSKINISPNPAKNYINLNITNNEKGDVKIKIKDSTGRVVMSISETKSNNVFAKKIDTSKLSSGIYLISIMVGSFEKTEKIVIY